MGMGMVKAAGWRVAGALLMLMLASGVAQATCSVFEHHHFGGWRLDLHGGSQWNYVGNRYNDKISSIRVSRGCTFTAYEHRDFHGWSQTYRTDTPTLGRGINDQISSGRCTCEVVVAPSASVGQLVSNVLNAVVHANRGRFQAVLRQELNGFQLSRGYNLREVSVNLGTLDVRMTGGTSFTATINNNGIRAKSTTPTIFGSYADPGFAVSFDLVVNGQMVRPGGGKMRMRSLNAQVTRINVRGTNFPGTVITAAVAIFQSTAAGGRMIQNAAQNALWFDLTNRVNAELAKL